MSAMCFNVPQHPGTTLCDTLPRALSPLLTALLRLTPSLSLAFLLTLIVHSLSIRLSLCHSVSFAACQLR